MESRIQQGQCFSCGTWVWASDPNGVLLPLSNCREGYLFCDNNQLAKITICIECEKRLLDGDLDHLNLCLKVFIEDFNGNSSLTSPIKYENSWEHWYNKGVYIPVPWKNTNNEVSLDQLSDSWSRFKTERQNNETPIFSQYIKGASDFYEYLADQLRDSPPPNGGK